MAETFLSPDVASSIADALKNDGTFTGTPEWADAHGFDLAEYDRFIEFGVQLAKMYEYRANHMGIPPMVEVKGTIEKAVTDKKGTKLTVTVPSKALSQIQPHIDQELIIQLFSEQMPLPMVDVETGELVFNE